MNYFGKKWTYKAMLSFAILLSTRNNLSMLRGIFQILQHMLILKIERHASNVSVANAATSWSRRNCH